MNDLSVFLLWTNIFLCPVAVACLLVRRLYPAASLFFIAGFFSIAALAWIDLQALQDPARILSWRKYGLAFEVAAGLFSYFYTKTVFRDNSEIYKGRGFWISIVVALTLFFSVVYWPVDALFFAPDFTEEKLIFLTSIGFAVYLVLMVFLIFALVQLERTFAGLHPLQRWHIKLEIIGSGLLLSSFALYFSHSLLYRSINMNYLAIRSAAVVLAILLIVYSRLFRSRDSRRLALSRGIAHRSFVLLMVGGYLIVLGAVGEGLRYLDIPDAKPIFYVILLFGGLSFAGIFLSETLRRKLKVLLHKNFYASKYDYREQWETFSQKITEGTSLTEIQSSILEFFCDPLACKGAVLYLTDPETNEFQPTATFNFRRDWRPFPQTDPMITMLRNKNWIINLRDANPELADSLIESLAESGIFLVVPLYFNDDLSGFILLGEPLNPDEELTYEDFDLLRMLARQAIATVQGLRLSEQLTAAREMAAIGKVSTFVLHDLKNQVSGLSLMLDNARDYLADPEFQQDMLETVENTVRNMNTLIARLKNLKEKPVLAIAATDLAKIVEDATETAGGNIELAGEPVIIAADDEEIYKVILNLLVNALEASDGNDPVKLFYGKRDGAAFVEVRDSGCGMSTEFIKTRLFKPFATTKKHGFGIGLYQCQQIIESHGGKIGVASSEGEGTRFTLTLPLAS